MKEQVVTIKKKTANVEDYLRIVMKRMIAINTASEGIGRTIRAQYWKNSLANFFHVGGGFGATAVIVYEDSDSRPKETAPGNIAPTLLVTDYK